MSDTVEPRPGDEPVEPEPQAVGAATGAAGVAPPEPAARSRSTWSAFRDPLLLAILVIALVADQISKQLVLEFLGPGTSWPDDGFFRFTFVRNDGTAFGFFQDNGALLTVVSLGAVGLIVYFYREAAMASWFTRAALGLQLGGAAGNLIDRFRHGFVVDFIDVGPWPIFNIADSAIITGIVALVAYFTLFGGREHPFVAKPGAETPETNDGSGVGLAPPLNDGAVPPPDHRD